MDIQKLLDVDNIPSSLLYEKQLYELMDTSLDIKKEFNDKPLITHYGSWKYVYEYDPPVPENETPDQKYARENYGKNFIVLFTAHSLYFDTIKVSHLEPKISYNEFENLYTDPKSNETPAYSIGFGFSTSKKEYTIDSYSATGEGDAYRIFGTVKNAVVRFMKENGKNVKALEFEAVNLEGNLKTYEHRVRLYNILSKDLARAYKFSLYTRKVGYGATEYYLLKSRKVIRKKSVKKVK